MVGYWPLAFFCKFMDLYSISVHKHAKKTELDQYPAILTPHLVNNSYIWRNCLYFFPKKLHLQKPTVKTRRSLGLANGHDILSMTGLAATGRCVHFPALVRPQRYMWVHTYKKHGWNLTHACTPIVSKLSVLEYCQVSSQQIILYTCIFFCRQVEDGHLCKYNIFILLIFFSCVSLKRY